MWSVGRPIRVVLHCCLLIAGLATMLLPLAGGVSAAAVRDAQEVEGRYGFEPAAPAAESPFDVVVQLHHNRDPLPGAAVTAVMNRPGMPGIEIFLLEVAPGTYRSAVTLPKAADWHITLFATVDGVRAMADSGFSIGKQAGLLGLAVAERGLRFRQAGTRIQPRWTDQATWISLFGLTLLVAAGFWPRRGRLAAPTLSAADSPVPATAPPIPGILVTLAFLGSLAGVASGFWDIGWHFDGGRDRGLFSPPHLGIYGGIILSLAALVGPQLTRAGRRRFRQTPVWIFAMLAMLLQLSSAPLDEWWHRTMGLDISVWAPPHFLLIFGGLFATLGLAVLGTMGLPRPLTRLPYWRAVGFGAVTLMFGDTWLEEFARHFMLPDWHVGVARPIGIYPVYSALFLALFTVPIARATGRRWTATRVAAVYWLLRLIVVTALLPALDRSQPWLPSLAVLPAAIALDWVLQRRPGLTFGNLALAGAAAATAYFAFYTPGARFSPVLPISPVDLAVWWIPAALLTAAAATIGGHIRGSVRMTAGAAHPVNRPAAYP